MKCRIGSAIRPDRSARLAEGTRALLMDDQDREYMKMALSLARKGAGLVSPNPMVGAVIVKDGRIVGQGYHRYDLLKHAEVNALEEAGEHARGATLYCSLEPCCHHGRTPPCTDALIESGIARAVVAISDPDPRVNGRGFALMRGAGIVVETGLYETEAARVNEKYIKFITSGLPFIHAVFIEDRSGNALSSSGSPVWKPSIEFNEMAAEFDAVVLGDNPDLNHAIAGTFTKQARHRPVEIALPLDSGIQQPPGGAALNPSRFSTPDELRTLINSWKHAGTTSILVFSSLDNASLIEAIKPIDKVTIVCFASVLTCSAPSSPSGPLPAVERVESELSSESGHIELTGYPAKST